MSQRIVSNRAAACALVLAGVAVARMLAQTPAPQANGSLAGRVFDGSTGQAVVGAEVMLDPTGRISSRDGDTRTGRTATTDARGGFAFSDVAPGSHQIKATRTGYRTGYAGGVTATQGSQIGPLQLAAGEARAGIVVRMWQAAAISGKVRLASGTPLVRMTVSALRAFSECGVDRLQFGGTTTTDDTGAYRFFDLAPGSYVIGTTPVRGSTLASGPYPTTYYPGVIDPAAARPVNLRGGDDQVDVDVVVPNAGFTVSGRVVLADGSAASGRRRVDLRAAAPSPIVEGPVARAFTEPDGTFRISNVPPGHYLARIVEFPPVADGAITQQGSGFMLAGRGTSLPPVPDAPTLWGEARIDVVDRDVDSAVRLQEGWRIQGKVIFEAAKGGPPAAAMESMPVLTFTSDGSDPGGAFQSGRVEKDGRFTTVALPPGRYLLSMLLQLPTPTPTITGLSLQAVRQGGRDVTGSAIEVNGGDVSDVTITYTDRGPTITGTVDGGADLDALGSRVYIFPTDEHSWSDCGSGWPRLTVAPVGADGRFKTPLLPPGEYFAAATIGAEEFWIETNFLRSLVPFAARVKLALGDAPSVQLKTRPRK